MSWVAASASPRRAVESRWARRRPVPRAAPRVVGHLVEGGAEPRELVAALDLDAAVEPAAGDRVRGGGEAVERGHDRAADRVSDERDQEQRDEQPDQQPPVRPRDRVVDPVLRRQQRERRAVASFACGGRERAVAGAVHGERLRVTRRCEWCAGQRTRASDDPAAGGARPACRSSRAQSDCAGARATPRERDTRDERAGDAAVVDDREPRPGPDHPWRPELQRGRLEADAAIGGHEPAELRGGLGAEVPAAGPVDGERLGAAVGGGELAFVSCDHGAQPGFEANVHSFSSRCSAGWSAAPSPPLPAGAGRQAGSRKLV